MTDHQNHGRRAPPSGKGESTDRSFWSFASPGGIDSAVIAMRSLHFVSCFARHSFGTPGLSTVCGPEWTSYDVLRDGRRLQMMHHSLRHPPVCNRRLQQPTSGYCIRFAGRASKISRNSKTLRDDETLCILPLLSAPNRQRFLISRQDIPYGFYEILRALSCVLRSNRPENHSAHLRKFSATRMPNLPLQSTPPLRRTSPIPINL